MLFQRTQGISRVWTQPRTVAPDFELRHPTIDLMVRSGSLVVSFVSAVEAVAAAGICSRLSTPPAKVWSFAGFDASLRVQIQWAHRPLLQKLMGAGEEDRIVARLAEHLEGGATVLVLRAMPTSEILQALSSATSIESVGLWTCRRFR